MVEPVWTTIKLHGIPEVEALFHDLADLSLAEALSALEARCVGVPELRSAVEELLRRDRALRSSFLQPSATLAAEVVDAAEKSAAGRFEPDLLENDTRIDHFRIVGRLGQGSAGAVYLAHDEALDRRVALKVMSHGAPGSRSSMREARALARLSHPNVVRVYEIGQYRGRPYLAMEWIYGRSLRVWLGEQPRSAAEILDVFLQAGRGLAAAHEAGLVHCDFKPENVLVASDGRVAVVDFGVAVIVSTDTRSRGFHPAPGVFALSGSESRRGLGTPAFMAPEQFAGVGVTPASDQFAFCVALYSALFGLTPFAGSDIFSLRKSVLAGALRKPPRQRAYPTALLGALERGLARQPAARFQDMPALLAALERHLPPPSERDPAVGSRERMLVCGGLAVLGAIALAALCYPPTSALAPQTTSLLIIPAIALLLHAIFASVLRQRLLANQFARKVAAMAWIGGITVILHRLLAFRFGQRVPDVIAVDLLMLGLEQIMAGILLDRWFGFGAALFLGAAGTAVYAPWQAITLMLGSVVAAYSVAVVRAALESRAGRLVR
jgi:eukaryotic-like serine/threonine-protein kinase